MEEKLFVKLLEIGILQKKALEMGDFEYFGELLDRRHEVIETIKRIDCKERMSRDIKFKELIDKINVLEEENQLLFIKEFEQVKRDLKTARESNRCRNQYDYGNSIISEEGIFFDKKNI